MKIWRLYWHSLKPSSTAWLLTAVVTMSWAALADDLPCEVTAWPCDVESCAPRNFLHLSLSIAEEYQGEYERTDFYGANASRSWADQDADCQDTRAEVLIVSSLIPIVYGGSSCWVEAGLWHDKFTDKLLEKPSDVEIDHIVPLKEAHQSGAYRWDQKRRFEFANDYDKAKNLTPLWYSTNHSKGALEPHQWLPPNEESRCEYVNRWVFVKWYWELSVDTKECRFTRQLLQQCVSSSRVD